MQPGPGVSIETSDSLQHCGRFASDSRTIYSITVILPSINLLGVVFGASEIVLSLWRRSKVDATADDRGSLRLIWMVVPASLLLTYALTRWAPFAAFGPSAAFYQIGVLLFGTGLVLRWYCILYLGRYFTVNVSVSADHRVIDSGPYRHIRHPSYAGALLEFLGFALCLLNLAALAAIMIPVTLAFSYRIRVEEAVLADALGENYRRYMRHTKRLIPGVY